MQGFVTLLYHEVRETLCGSLPIDVADGYSDQLPESLYIRTDQLGEQLLWLRKEGFQSLSLEDIRNFYREGIPLPEKSFQISFDDMYQSSFHFAYPLLKEFGMKATGFVVGDWVFDQPSDFSPGASRTLSWPELDEMADVFEYAHHSSALHRRDENGSLFASAETEYALRDISRYSDRLSHPRIFAYPFGLYDERTLNTLAQSDIQLAYTTRPGRNLLSTPQLELKRNIILPGNDIRKIVEMVN